jgi:hypothetical protein
VNHLITSLTLNLVFVLFSDAKSSSDPALAQTTLTDPTTEWTPHKVELALWTHFMAKELKPSLFESMPQADGSVRAAATTTKTDLVEEETSNTSDRDIGNSDPQNGNGSHNGRHAAALDEDSNISVPASGTGSVSGEDSKLSNGDDDSRQSGEFRTPYAAANNNNSNNNSSSSMNHHIHLSTNSNESSAESLSNASESNPSSVADDTSQGSASVPGNGIDHHNHEPVVPCHPLSLSHATDDANHVVSNSSSCASELPATLSPQSLDEPALKKIRASE